MVHKFIRLCLLSATHRRHMVPKTETGKEEPARWPIERDTEKVFAFHIHRDNSRGERRRLYSGDNFGFWNVLWSLS